MPYFLLDNGRPTGYWVLDGFAYWLWVSDFLDGAGEFFVVAQKVGIIATMVVVAFDDFAT